MVAILLARIDDRSTTSYSKKLLGHLSLETTAFRPNLLSPYIAPTDWTPDLCL